MTGWFRELTAQALLQTALFLLFGYLLADVLTARRRWDVAVTLALALPALVAFTLVLMIAHMVTGGEVLSRPWVVRGVTAAVFVALAIRKIVMWTRNAGWDVKQVLPMLGIVALGLVVWGYPVARIVPLASGGDIRWHLGWASQIMNGETTPNSILTGSIPNYYPWMYHALMSFMASFTPGGHAYHALAPIHLLQVTAVILALFALGKELGKSWLTGAGVALFGALAAGPLLRSSSVATHPADLGARGTYNASLYNIAPPLPRDVAFALLVAFLLLLVLGLREQSRGELVAAGLVLGMVGLATWEAFFVGVGVAVVVAVLPGQMSRASRAASLLLPAAAVYAIWIVPLAVTYVGLGGFTNTTAGPPPILSAVAILLSWGLATPLAVYAVVRWVPAHRHDPGIRAPIALLLASVAVVAASSLIPLFLGKSFATLGRAARYWPNMYLGVAIFAGVGAAELLRQLARVRVWMAAVPGALLVVVAAAVPFAVSLDIPNRWRDKPVLAGAMLGRQNFLADVAATGRADCVIASPRYIQMTIFSYAGYRQVAYRGADAHVGNYSRIRWRDIYEQVPDDAERLADNEILTSGDASIPHWRDLIRKYGVDIVVTRKSEFDGPVFRKLFPRELAQLARERRGVGVFRVNPCDPS